MNERPHVRAVAVDLDDTMLRPDKTVSPRSLAAWESCRARGLTLIVATARSETAAARHIETLRPDAVVSNSGALVRAGGRVLFARTLAPETVCALVQAVRAQGGGCFNSETVDGNYWDETAPAQHPEYGPSILADFTTPLPPAYKLTCEMPGVEAARAVAAQFPQCSLTAYAGQKWFRFSPVGVDKASGLRVLCRELSLDPADIAAFGDDYSDETMLSSVGWGIAMGNAVDAVKRAACEVTCDNASDGVAVWLERCVLAEDAR